MKILVYTNKISENKYESFIVMPNANKGYVFSSGESELESIENVKQEFVKFQLENLTTISEFDFQNGQFN